MGIYREGAVGMDSAHDIGDGHQTCFKCIVDMALKGSYRLLKPKRTLKNKQSIHCFKYL